MQDLDLRDRLRSLEHEVRALRDWAARLFTRFPTIPGGGSGDCQITIGCGLEVTPENELQIAAAVLIGAGLVGSEDPDDCPLNVNPGDGVEINQTTNQVQAKLARGLTFTTTTREVEALLGNCLEFDPLTGAIDVDTECVGVGDCNLTLGCGIGMVGDELFTKIARGLVCTVDDEIEARLGTCLEFDPVTGAIDVDMDCVGECNMTLGVGLDLVGDELFVKLAADGGLEANGSGELQSLSRLFIGHANFNPADATTYYFGCMPGLGADSTAGNAKFKVPTACTIRKVNLRMTRSTATSPTNESVAYYIRVNDTTDHLISNSVDLSSVSTEVDNTSLSIALAADDVFEIKMVTPTWTTNPTAVRAGGYLTFAG